MVPLSQATLYEIATLPFHQHLLSYLSPHAVFHMFFIDYLFIVCGPPTECKLHEDRDFIRFVFTVTRKALCIEYALNKYLLNGGIDGWMEGWTNELIHQILMPPSERNLRLQAC